MSDITGFCLSGTALDVVVFMIKLFLHYENAFFYYAHYILSVDQDTYSKYVVGIQ